MRSPVFSIERGVRFPDDPRPLIGFRKQVIESGEPILVTEDFASARPRPGSRRHIIGEPAQSAIFAAACDRGGDPRARSRSRTSIASSAFDERDVSLLTTIAASLSVALRTGRLIDETQQRVAELGTINSVGEAISAQLDLEPLLEIVGEKTREAFEADIAYVALLDEERCMIDFPYYVEAEAHAPQEPLALGEGLTSHVLEREEAAPPQPRGGLGGARAARPGHAGAVLARRADHGRRPGHRRHQHPEHDPGGPFRRRRRAAAGDHRRQRRRRDPERPPVRRDRRRADEMAALAEVGRETSATLDVSRVLELIAERARRPCSAATRAPSTSRPTERDAFRAEVAVGDIADEIRADSNHARRGDHRRHRRHRPGRADQQHRERPARPSSSRAPTDTDGRLMAAPLMARDAVAGVLVVWRGARTSRSRPPTSTSSSASRSRRRSPSRMPGSSPRPRRRGTRPSRRTRRRAASWPP